jgi:hypothetical protein
MTFSSMSTYGSQHNLSPHHQIKGKSRHFFLYRFPVKSVSALFMIALFVLSYDAKPVFGIPDFSGEMRKEICASGGENAREAPCENFMEGELLVKFKQGIGRKNKNNVHGKHFSKIKKKFFHNNIDHVGLAPGLDIQEAIREYATDPAVEYAEPNYILHANSTFPDDPYFTDLWNLLNLGQTGGTPGADIDATRA